MPDSKKLYQRPKDYRSLELAMVKYRDLINIPVEENSDPFTLLPASENIVLGKYLGLFDMKEEFPQIPVRDTIKTKLENVATILFSVNPSVRLQITYGYRSLEVQEKYFEEQRALMLDKDVPADSTIEEEVHRLIAVPSVAGHPTGGAVDVLLTDEIGIPLDFGTTIYDFTSKDSYALSPYINDIAKKNRALLRQVMMSEGFAPYDGEWWHFSYGDKEWSFYYKKTNAIYEQKKTLEVKNSLGDK